MKHRIAAVAGAAVLVAAFTAPTASAIGTSDNPPAPPAADVAPDPVAPEPTAAEPAPSPAPGDAVTEPVTAEPAATEPAATGPVDADPADADPADEPLAASPTDTPAPSTAAVEPCSGAPGANPNACVQLTFPDCTAWSIDVDRFGVQHCNDAAAAAGKGRPYTATTCSASGVWQLMGTTDVQNRQRYTCTIPAIVTTGNVNLTSMCRPGETHGRFRLTGPAGASWVLSKYGSPESYSGQFTGEETFQDVRWVGSSDTWILTVTGSDGSTVSKTKAVGDNPSCGTPVESTPISVPFSGISVPFSGISVPSVGLAPATPLAPVTPVVSAPAPLVRTQPTGEQSPDVKETHNEVALTDVAADAASAMPTGVSIQHRPTEKPAVEDIVQPDVKAVTDSKTPVVAQPVGVSAMDPVFAGAVVSFASSQVTSTQAMDQGPQANGSELAPVDGDAAPSAAAPASPAAPLSVSAILAAAVTALVGAFWFIAAARRRRRHG